MPAKLFGFILVLALGWSTGEGLADSGVEKRAMIRKKFASVSAIRLVADLVAPGGDSMQLIIIPDSVKEVVGQGKPVVRPLISLLRHEVGYVRTLSLFCLHQITNELTGGYDQVYYKSDGNKIVAQWEQWWEKNKNDARIDWLIRSMHPKREPANPPIRRAINMLGDLGDPKAVPHIVPFLKSHSGRYEYPASIALAKLENDAALPGLIYTLNHDMEGFRSRAIEYLIQLTGRDFGFKADGPPELRNKSILRWQQWLKEKQSAGGKSTP